MTAASIDDPSIDDGTTLFRWVPPAHIRRTAEGPEWRDGVFKNFPRREELRMSVVLQDRLEELGRTPESILEGRPGHGLVGILAGDVRAEEQKIERTPLEEELAHGDVCGEKPSARRRILAGKAFWVIEPPEIS